MNEAFRNDRANELYHICQISADKGVIFYTVWDYIVFFCLLCTNVRRYKVTLVAATLMLNHIHVAFSGNLSEITNCMRTTLSSFSLEYNSRGGTCILHFKKGLNKSQKSSGKKNRSCLVYILNNPVEKNACNKAFEYRWNFLQYHSNSHPFSEEIILRRCDCRCVISSFPHITQSTTNQWYHDSEVSNLSALHWKRHRGDAYV